MSLSNGGDTVTLLDGALIVDQYQYVDGEVNDESLARDPDGIGPFVGTNSGIEENFILFATPGTTNVGGDPFNIGASVTIVESGGNTSVSEAGLTSDSFTFALASQPSGTVTVAIASTNGEVTLSTTTLTFTTGNWATPQTITVTAADDMDLEGPHTDLVTFTLTNPGGTYDGLAVSGVTVNITDDDVPTSTVALVNEFVADHTGGDTEAFVEIFVPGATGPTDVSGLWLLEIEGGTAFGNIDEAIQLTTTDANGYLVLDLDVENDTVTYLLVSGFTGAVNDDLDTNDDGVLDVTPWTAIVDSVATVEDLATDRAYSAVQLLPGADGDNNQYGGASRIPNGTDTDTAADWVRNNFFGAGFLAFPTATANPGEAVNTPGAPNMLSNVVQPAGITVDEFDGVMVAEENETSDTFTVVLDTLPTDTVTLTLASANAEVTLDVTTLVFTASNWDTPQTVTVTAIDDTDVEGNHVDTISFSVTTLDGDYAVLDPSNLSVQIVDNDGSSGLSPGDLVINEIMQNPSAVDDTFGEYVEIWNTTGSSIDLNGFILRDNDSDSHVIDSANGPTVVPAGGYLVLVRNADPLVNGGISNAYPFADFQLSNGADEVVLEDNFGLILDEVIYDGGPGFPDPTARSMELIPGLVDPHLANDLGANWQEGSVVYGAGDFGTPGAVNTGTVTTPAPQVVGVTINQGATFADSRSKVTSVTIEFDSVLDAISLADAFTITNITTGQVVNTVVVTPVDGLTTTTVTLTFGDGGLSVVNRFGTGLLDNSLADGNYRLDVDATKVLVAGGSTTMELDFLIWWSNANVTRQRRFFPLIRRCEWRRSKEQHRHLADNRYVQLTPQLPN